MQHKRILSLLLALCLLCVCLPTTARAAEIDNGTCGDDLTWTLYTDGTLTISGTGPMTEYASFSSVPWDACREIISSVVIGDGVTSIGAYAFYECLNLPGITLPAGITAIGSSAFEYCRSLTEITIPAQIAVIGPRAFRECSSLTQINFSGDAPAISDSAFENVTAKVSYPAGSDTWTEDTILSYGGSLTWGNASEPARQPVASIASGSCGESLIWALSSDGTLTISGTGPMTDYSTFSSVPWDAYREFISSVVLGNDVTSIGAYAFYECINLPEITIPASVTAVGVSAFQFCYSLTEITFTGSAPTISNTAFGNVTATVYYPTDDATWTSAVMKNYGGLLSWGAEGQPVEKPANILDSGVCGDDLTWTLSTDGTLTFSGTGPMTDYSTFSSVPWDAYREFISSVTIGEGVTSIGAYALYECINLSELTIPASVTRIDTNAFVFCGSLTAITFLGDYPEMTNALDPLTAYAYYPGNNATWTEEKLLDHGSHITWVPYYSADILLGDVNGNGEVDIMDANLVVAYYNETIDLTEDQLLAADVDSSGQVDIMDANLIVAYYNETIESFPVED